MISINRGQGRCAYGVYLVEGTEVSFAHWLNSPDPIVWAISTNLTRNTPLWRQHRGPRLQYEGWRKWECRRIYWRRRSFFHFNCLNCALHYFLLRHLNLSRVSLIVHIHRIWLPNCIASPIPSMCLPSICTVSCSISWVYHETESNPYPCLL